MRHWQDIFVEHPATVGESYTEHMGMAFSFGRTMVVAGVACLLHGLVPALFKTTGSEAIRTLHDRMVVNRNRKVRADDRVRADEMAALAGGD